MFENLTDRLSGVFKKLRGYGKLTEHNIQDALKEIRIVLLEADVNYKVAKTFINNIKDKAVGREVLESLTPAQQIIKIVNDELILLLGGEKAGLNLSGKSPSILMLIGLQGSGKTTTAGKLANYLKNAGYKPYLVSTDVYRPAAMEQLQKIGGQLDIPVYHSTVSNDPVRLATESVRVSKMEGFDPVILDTAGRLHINDELMNELEKIKEEVKPNEILFVADAMTGQDAVNVASKFNEALDITGIILTKMDGDARGGAALSIKDITGKPIKFVGIGEKLDALESFYPDRMASRIIGMGDVLSLIEKAQASYDEKKASELERKFRKDEFTLEDFREQIQMIKKVGSFEQIIGMLPGMGKLKNAPNMVAQEKELVKIEAMINSMTKKERLKPSIINGSRRKRIAMGSGTTVQDINRLLKNYTEVKKLMKKITSGNIKRLSALKGLGFGNLRF
ncbi:MAG: signal recognition particle protein [Thermodesulfobacteriota bacterium]|nr:signal recognition particle protein [Thermodesulfobacteriota bacterium]